MNRKKIILISILSTLILAFLACALWFCRGGGEAVYLSPSAQDANIYTNSDLSERESMNRLAEALEVSLADVCPVTRPDGTGTLDDYIDESRALDGVLHIALHSNATGVEGSATRGCEIYVRPGDWESRRLADCIYAKLSALTPSRDRGVKNTTTLKELNSVPHTAVLIEVDFHDNADGAAWIAGHYADIAGAIAAGVEDYMGGAMRGASFWETLRGLV